MDYIQSLENAGDELINALRTAQESALNVVERLSETFGAIVHRIGLPVPAALPRAREAAESVFRFWERLAENQKEVTFKLLDAIEPATGRTRKAA